jgi:hypothetical protein
MQKTNLNIRSSYKRYSKEMENPIELKTFIPIANGYMEFLMAKVISGEEVTLPAKLGTLFIQGVKKKLTFNKQGVPLLPPNWGETKKLWERNPDAKATKKIVYCLNEETNGVVYKLHWSKNRVPIENKLYYNFILTRENKRTIHKAIKQGKEYIIKTE